MFTQYNLFYITSSIRLIAMSEQALNKCVSGLKALAEALWKHANEK